MDSGGSIGIIQVMSSNRYYFEYKGNDQTVPKDVVSVRFHPSVVKVDLRAFMRCNELREVVFNEGLQKIGSTSFYDCIRLERIALPSTLIEIGNCAFSRCPNLRDVVFNEGLQKIGDYAFDQCAVRNITIPSTVTEIGSHAFSRCSDLHILVLNEDIPKELGKMAFHMCTSLFEITFPGISSRLNNIIEIPGVYATIDEASGVVRRRGGELCCNRLMLDGYKWGRVKQSVDKIVRLIRYYEIKEATTLFELVLWKLKLDQAEEATDINRYAFHIEVPGPVKDAILQYIGKSLV